jgi:hypothetical protein
LRDEPKARFLCGSDGQLWLIGVELSAWQGIKLPRQWDNPDREWDAAPDAQLADFAGRVRQALETWEKSLEHLQSPSAG